VRAFNTLLARLEQRSLAHEAFVADLAHELKNPVAAVRAVGESLAQGTADAERAARLSRILIDSGQRMDDLLSQLLELARAEAGLATEPRSSLDLGELIAGLTEAARLDERHRGIRFELIAPPAARITGVASRLETALRNLLDNAASFAAPSPSGDRWVRIVLSIGAQAELQIDDSGPGIRPEDLPRVFDRFFTTRPERRGTGLGLAMVRAVVEAHGGAVRAESPPGQGARFVVSLPLG
jgi:two-component system sensor histidine kinase ChvG